MNWKEFFATGLYTGYFPKASGTVGALLAALIYITIHQVFGSYGVIANGVLVALLVYPAIRLGDYAERYFNTKDPQEVVLDEMLGLWVTMLFHSFSMIVVVLGFFLFRLFDIIKPFPIRRFEHLHGGLGIMLDDIIAGIYANITVTVLVIMLEAYGVILV